jgi:twitching motility protein PilT
MANLHDLLKYMIEKGASDLHITTGISPSIRIDGKMKAIPGLEPLSGTQTKDLCYSILTDAQKHKFEENSELDLSFGVKNLSRFRANIYVQRGAVAAAIRTIPFKIKTFQELGLPEIVADLCRKPRGLVLVTGPTGSGKSTTLASMVDKVNSERQEHIITIEDPIEYVHQHKKCIVNQREVRADTDSFGAALKHVLRQDPDVILIGEMRDLETMAAALTIAETGHLTLATLHTNSTYESINRIVDSFPSAQQGQVRAQLAFVLEGVLTQQLIPRKNGKGRCMVCEIMICTPAIRATIRDDKIHQIYGLMQAGQKYGMQTMNQGLFNACIKSDISHDEAMRRSSDPDELSNMLGEKVKTW